MTFFTFSSCICQVGFSLSLLCIFDSLFSQLFGIYVDHIINASWYINIWLEKKSASFLKSMDEFSWNIFFAWVHLRNNCVALKISFFFKIRPYNSSCVGNEMAWKGFYARYGVHHSMHKGPSINDVTLFFLRFLTPPFPCYPFY